MRGERPATHENAPQCGWFKRRLVKGGAWVPAMISLHQVIEPETGELAEPEQFICVVCGERRDAFRQWVRLSSNPISEDTYTAMLAEIDRAGSEDPMNPILRPHEPIDLSRSATCPPSVTTLAS